MFENYDGLCFKGSCHPGPGGSTPGGAGSIRLEMTEDTTTDTAWRMERELRS